MDLPWSYYGLTMDFDADLLPYTILFLVIDSKIKDSKFH